VPHGHGREIGPDKVRAFHGYPLVEAEKPDAQVCLGIEAEEPLVRQGRDFEVGEADLFTVEDDPCPELSVGKIVQALESEGVARRLDGIEVRWGTGQKGK
jgi:hypothetical protein